MKLIKSTVATFSILVLSPILVPKFGAALAQNLPQVKLNTIVVTANPLNRHQNDLAQPTAVLFGDELLKKSQTTIGETLSQELGIRSSYYGPNASRPVIRGLDGDQIQILQNGVSNLDASANSADHNISIDPLTIKRIEVVRGPAALLYGSKAVGGVVNIIDNRIPDEPFAEKITGTTDARYNTVNKERAGSLLLEGGVENYAWHINGFKRITDNLSIPGFARTTTKRADEPLAEGQQESKNKLANSQSNSEGTTVGLSRFFKKGYFGVALSDYNSNYGTVSEPNVTIGMLQQRLDVAGAYREPVSEIKEIKYKIGFSNYKHTEFEGSQAGSVFKNRGYDSRVEVVHNKLAMLEGAVGVQSSMSDFSASGEEAFLPPTTTHTNSAFILEEIALKKIRYQFGGRMDYQTVQADTNQAFSQPDSRDEITKSASAGFVYKPLDGYAVALSTSYTERAANAQELFANGPHIATNAFEIGNRNLKNQKSYGVDLSLRKESGDIKGEINLFYNKFNDFINLMATGQTHADSGLQIYNFNNLDAEFYGAEAKINFDLYNKNAKKFAFEIRSDYVEARNSKTNEPLPRIAPLRVGGSALYSYYKLNTRLDIDYNFAQNHTAELEQSTKGFTMINASADYPVEIGKTRSVLYLKAINLLNQEARNHVSFLKNVAPLPARGVMIGVRTSF